MTGELKQAQSNLFYVQIEPRGSSKKTGIIADIDRSSQRPTATSFLSGDVLIAMSAFDSRTQGYKAGVILLFVAAVLFLIAYATPYWSQASKTFADAFGIKVEYSEGLWMMCISGQIATVSSTECGQYGVIGFRECCRLFLTLFLLFPSSLSSSS